MCLLIKSNALIESLTHQKRPEISVFFLTLFALPSPIHNICPGAATAMTDMEVSNITATCTAELSSMMGPHSAVLQEEEEASFEEGLCLDKSDGDDAMKGIGNFIIDINMNLRYAASGRDSSVGRARDSW